MEMKQKLLALMLMCGGGLFSACTLENDDTDEFKPKTETWTVTIEPEYVFGGSYWGAYTGLTWQMEAKNDQGERVGTFFLDEIDGFTFEEGYRYKLKIDATTTDPRIVDNSAYTFKLKKILSREYIGIRTEGRREVTMDVRTVLLLPPNPYSSIGYYYLCGQTLDGSEKLDMGLGEIYGVDYDQFLHYDDAGNLQKYGYRMRLSITPSESPVYQDHHYRIRLEELISKKELQTDSVVVTTTEEEFNSKMI
jgi:hypothetical protein